MCNREDMKAAKIQRFTEAIWNNLAPWERGDYEKSDITEYLENDPFVVVEFLIDRFIES